MKGLKTGGRQRGTPNRKTVARRELIQTITAATMSPLEFLLCIMRSNSLLIDMKMRVDAARAALPFCHVKAGETGAPGDQAKLVETATQPPRQWTLADTGRLAYLREQELLGGLKNGSALHRELDSLRERWYETTDEGRAEMQRERDEIGF
jgi:hypothetical protein